MILTNHHNLPEPFVHAWQARRERYERGRGETDISATQLIDPPRLVELRRQHEDRLEVDILDEMWALFGTALHALLEDASDAIPHDVQEARLYGEVRGWRVSGMADRIVTGNGSRLEIQDWKVTSAWALTFGSRLPEWEAQLNILAELARMEEMEPTSLEIVALLRDWSAWRAERETDYPQQQVMRIPIPLWDRGKAQSYLDRRVLEHQQCRGDYGAPHWEEFFICSDENRWAKPPQYAVKKRTNKTAYKLFDARPTDGEIAGVAQWKNVPLTALEVEKRPGDPWVRCRKYCPVASVCNQFQKGQS